MTIIKNLSLCSSADPCSSPEAGLAHERKQQAGFMARIVLNMKTKCSWRKKTKKMKKTKRERGHHHQEPIMADYSISKDLALEEWFAKSPSVENKRICDDEDEHRAGSNKSNNKHEDCVSLEELLNSSESNTSVETESASYSDSSFSLEKLLMMRENEDKKEEVEVVAVGLCSLSGSKSCRQRKVSFRLPEASDIMMLNSPER